MKRASIAALFIFAVVGLVGKAQALVEINWPAGVPNACKSSTDGFIDFESSQDGRVVRSTVPETQFTTTDGFDWLYADWRTHRYDGKYPSGTYTSNGNFFTWLGRSQGRGRIDFLLGAASYVSMLTSTESGLIVDAYDKNGTFLATSGRAPPNAPSGTLTRVTVQSPGGKNIAYVMVHDSANFWLVDDLCTDAAGVPPAYAAVAQTAKSVIGAIYTLGAKGYDGGTTGSKAFVSSDHILSTGYNYYEGAIAKSWIPGRGLDCSGLTMWSYNRTFFAQQQVNWNTCLSSKTCPVFQEGAHGQYDANTQRISAQDVRVGDLLFFDECIGSAASCTRGQDGVMDHVAMFVDSFALNGQTYDAVHASGFARATVPAAFDAATQTLTTRLTDGRIQVLRVAGYGRMSDPRLDAWVVTRSPVHLDVTDPEAVRVTHENALLNDAGHTREVPGMYYMVKEVVDGGVDDTVAIPRLKNGIYLIDVKPKPNTQPRDVFSLEVRLEGRTIVLADRNPLQDRSFAVEVSPQGVVEGLRVEVDIKPGDTVACINPKSEGNTPIAVLGSNSVNARSIASHTIELDLDSDRATAGVKPVRWSADSDVNGDGFPDLVLHFSTPALEAAGLLKDARRVFVTGQYGDGRPLAGADVVYIVGSSNCR